MGAEGATGALGPGEVVPQAVTRERRCLVEVGHKPAEAGILGREGEPNQGQHCTEGGKPEEEGGTALGLRTPVEQGQEGALSGDDWSCVLCSCKTCPMTYVLLGVSDGALGVLIDMKTCVLEEEGVQLQLNGSQQPDPLQHFQRVLKILAFVLLAEDLVLQVVVAHTLVVAAHRGSWCAQESGERQQRLEKGLTLELQQKLRVEEWALKWEHW